MHALRAILAAEALMLLTSSVYGMLMPEALMFVATGTTAISAWGLLPLLCSFTGAAALAQLQLLERPEGLAYRTLVQARLCSDILLLFALLMHTSNLQRYLTFVSLVLIFSAARFYSVVESDLLRTERREAVLG